MEFTMSSLFSYKSIFILLKKYKIWQTGVTCMGKYNISSVTFNLI